MRCECKQDKSWDLIGVGTVGKIRSMKMYKWRKAAVTVGGIYLLSDDNSKNYEGQFDGLLFKIKAIDA